MNKKIRRLFMIILILVGLTLYVGFLFQLYGDVALLEKMIGDLSVTAQEDLLDIVIAQSEFRAREFEDAFYRYQSIHQPDWFEKDKNGNVVFHNIEQDSYVSYDPDVHDLIRSYGKFYTIIDEETREVLYHDVAPEWNRTTLNNFLDIVVRQSRMFGPEGDPIIIDQRTKEILIDDSYNCADTPEVMGPDGRRYMTLDWLHPNNANPEASKWVIDNLLTWDNEDVWMYFFTYPDTTVGDLSNNIAFDFEKYPWAISSDVGREIGYTVVVTIRHELGITLPIRVMFGAQEYEFTPYFSDTYSIWNEVLTLFLQDKLLALLLPVAGLIFIVILFTAYTTVAMDNVLATKEINMYKTLDVVSFEEELRKKLK